MLQANPDNQEFLSAVSSLSVGEAINVADGVLIAEAIFDTPTHFPWHQRIFNPGIILKKQNSNVRIYIEAEKINLKKRLIIKGHFDDRQIVNGIALKGEGLRKEKVKVEKKDKKIKE